MITNSQLLSIKNWSVWPPRLLDVENNNSENSLIPANLKRRCSNLSKIAIETSNQAMKNQHIDYAIFCSRHGELDCSISLLKEISKQVILSPTKFSQSVHNTAAGLFSVIHRLHQDTISIAARNNTFFMGMIETFTWLRLNPNKIVLLVIFDDEICPEYKKINIDDNYDNNYAVAFLMTNQLTQPLFISLSLNQGIKQQTHRSLPLALDFLNWFLDASSTELIQSTEQYTVKWQKK